MTDQQRLAKLYGVGGLPFRVGSEFIYWKERVQKLGIRLSFDDFCNWDDKRYENVRTRN